MAPFESQDAVFYSPSMVTMALSCIVSEITRNIGRKSRFFSYPLAFDASVWGSPTPSKYCHTVCCGITSMVWAPDGEKGLICLAVSIKYRHVTDRRTDISRLHSPRYAQHRVVKTTRCNAASKTSRPRTVQHETNCSLLSQAVLTPSIKLVRSYELIYLVGVEHFAALRIADKVECQLGQDVTWFLSPYRCFQARGK